MYTYITIYYIRIILIYYVPILHILCLTKTIYTYQTESLKLPTLCLKYLVNLYELWIILLYIIM